jgi:hypothetical protein
MCLSESIHTTTAFASRSLRPPVKKNPHPAEPLAGRCARIQVLSLGYAEQPEPTKLPYLAAALRPAPALWLLGRGARMLPECSKKHAVFYGWRDQGGGVRNRSVGVSGEGQGAEPFAGCKVSKG